jgi:hypothetical protein
MARSLKKGPYVDERLLEKIEGKKPSFLMDIQFLLIGPAWLMGFIYKRMRIAL